MNNVKYAADKIELVSNGNTVSFQLKEGLWLVGSGRYLADKVLVHSMINELENFKFVKKIKLRTFEKKFAGTADAVNVKIYSGASVKLELKIYSNSKNREDVWVRIENDGKFPDVYKASELLFDDFTGNTDFYREKKIMTVLPELITKIEANVNLNTFVVEKLRDKTGKNFIWKDTRLRKELDQDAVTDLVAGFQNVRASGFPIGPITGQKTAFYDIYTEASLIKFEIYDKNSSGEYLCRSSESPYAFYWKAEDADHVLKTFAELMMKKE